MDVRCEKCQTEYELDESRLKPGGVTVKCTNCGHTFKVRKRSSTNVGVSDPDPMRARTSSARQHPLPGQVQPHQAPPPPRQAPPHQAQPQPRVDPLLEDERPMIDDEPTTIERQWLIRLENGEQKSCRELATLQQWIISSVVTRESLISRTGKTWKRLGDIADLGQYFTIADEARANRERSKLTPTPRPPAAPTPFQPTTLPGYSPTSIPGYAPQAAGGTILPDDDDERRTTRAFRGAPTPPPVPVRAAVRTPPFGHGETVPVMAPAPRPPPTQPPLPPRHTPAPSGPLAGPPLVVPPPAPVLPAPAIPAPPIVAPPPPIVAPLRPAGQTTPPPIPPGYRATAMWATEGIKPEQDPATTAPFIGKLSAIPDEPAFAAGRIRMGPGADAGFESGRVIVEDDDDVLPARRGSRTGMVVLIMALLVMGAAASVIYVFVIRGDKEPVAVTAPKDAAPDTAPKDAAPDTAPAVVAVTVDAAPAETVSPLDAARTELRADVEPRLRTAAQALDGKPDAPAQAMRAHLLAQLAQDLIDRASVTPDKPAADALRKDAKQLALDAMTAAQHALQTAGDDAGANLAMAEVLRLQGKPARETKRYLDTARGKADKDWARELALADALELQRDGKLEAVRAAFAAIDQGDGKLETSGDVRARFHAALVLVTQSKPADAKLLVDAILAAQPEHAGAKALAAKLETLVTQSDPLPPEEGSAAHKDPKPPAPSGTAHDPDPPAPGGGTGNTGNTYDQLLSAANKFAETSCAKATELYNKALEQKPNGVEALTGLGYCYVDAKQFSSAFSKFRTALVVSPKYEPALRGIAEGYLQQGLKDRAIEAYKAYLDVYPDSSIAKKQLDRLGSGSAQSPAPAAPAAPPAPAPPAPSGDSAPPPSPPPPAPGPTTSPEASGTDSK
jgi:predicted Zn finger-like uncharacterized protein